MSKLYFNITDQNIDDILITGLEGGINYWCGKVTVKNDDYKGADLASDSVSKGATLILMDAEDLSNTSKIDKPKILKAIERYINEYNCTIIDLENKEIDCGQVDATVADIIIQLAAFEEVIYG